MRLNGVADLASRYSVASADQQAVLLQSFLDLNLVIGSFFHGGQLLQGAGFLLVAWTALSVAGFPRWLAYWIGLPGLTSLALFVIDFLFIGRDAPSFFFPVLLFHIVVGIIALDVTMASRFWRPSPELVSAFASE